METSRRKILRRRRRKRMDLKIKTLVYIYSITRIRINIMCQRPENPGEGDSGLLHGGTKLPYHPRYYNGWVRATKV